VIVALLYLAAIMSAELVTAFCGASAGVIFNVLLMFCLVLHSSLAKDPSRRLYLALAFAPLIRIVSLSMPFSETRQVYWYPIAAVPLFIGVLIAIKTLHLRRSDISLAVGNPISQGLVALTGVGFGSIEYLILQPDALLPTLSVGKIALLSAMFLICTGFLEELAFRGVVQRSAEDALGGWGWVYTAGVFSMLYIGYLSVAQWSFALLVGLYFGWVVRRTGSLLGVTLSHGIANVMLFVVLPSLAH
jgi:membrane protease YdiL (CAAX protease family)